MITTLPPLRLHYHLHPRSREVARYYLQSQFWKLCPLNFALLRTWSSVYAFVAVELNPSAWPSTAHVFSPDDAEFRMWYLLLSCAGSDVHMFLCRRLGYRGSLEGNSFYAEGWDTLGPSKATALYESAGDKSLQSSSCFCVLRVAHSTYVGKFCSAEPKRRVCIALASFG